MIAQFQALKQAHPDALLFFRMGDFYELFFEDAVAAAPALDIALTKRGRHAGEDIAMCGVPVHSAEVYLHRLIRKGFKVAICEQLEDPGRGPQAAGQAAGPARRGPDRHRRHAHRGRPARPAAQQLAGGTGRERGRARPRPGRHLDRRLRHRTGRPERAGGRTRAPGRRRDPGPGPAAGRARRPLPRGRCRHHAAGGRELRQHRCRAPPVPRLRRRHARRARRVRPGRAGGGRRHPGLSRADAERGFCPASTGRGASSPRA